MSQLLLSLFEDPCLRAGLGVLIRRYDGAELPGPRPNPSAGFEGRAGAALAEDMLRWFAAHGYAGLSAPPGGPEGLVLPPAGAAGVEGPPRAPAGGHPPDRPRWDRFTKELRLGPLTVKTFKRRAPIQMCILDGFEELGWPERMDDPLPGKKGGLTAERLRKAVYCLNQGQLGARVWFRIEADGRGLRWQAGVVS